MEKKIHFERVTQACQHACRHNQVELWLQSSAKNHSESCLKSLLLDLLFLLLPHFPCFSSQAEAKVTEEHMEKEFESLHRFLREEEAARLVILRKKQEEKKREAGEQIDRMNQAIKSLEEKIQLIEEELDAGGDGVKFLEVTSIKCYIISQWVEQCLCLYLVTIRVLFCRTTKTRWTGVGHFWVFFKHKLMYEIYIVAQMQWCNCLHVHMYLLQYMGR